MIGYSFGGYAAGSGAAGLLGSFTYTLLTSSCGVTPSAVLSGIGFVPTIMLLTYSLVLPSPKNVSEAALANSKDINDHPMQETGGRDRGEIVSGLELGDKIRMVRPMVIGYMTPLAVLMFLENVTTQVRLTLIPCHIFHKLMRSCINRGFFLPFCSTSHSLRVSQFMPTSSRVSSDLSVTFTPFSSPYTNLQSSLDVHLSPYSVSLAAIVILPRYTGRCA